jgi:hypothetical protein
MQLSVFPKAEAGRPCPGDRVVPPCSLGLSVISQQYFSLRTNQPLATSEQYFSLRTNQHQPSATSQTNRLGRLRLVGFLDSTVAARGPRRAHRAPHTLLALPREWGPHELVATSPRQFDDVELPLPFIFSPISPPQKRRFVFLVGPGSSLIYFSSL